MARGPRHEFTILCIMHSSLWLHLHLSWLHFHCGPHKCPHMAVFHCSGNPNLPLQSHGLHAEHTALSRPTDANVLPQPLSASPGVYAAQTNKKELMVTAEQLQAELTGAVSELDALLPEMGSDAHRRNLAAPLHLSFRPEPVRRSQVRQLGRRRRVRDPATEQEPRRPRREVHLLMRDVERVWRWARLHDHE